MTAMKRDAGTDYHHVLVPVFCQALAGAEGDAVLLLQDRFLFEQKIYEIIVGAEFVSQRIDDLFK